MRPLQGSLLRLDWEAVRRRRGGEQVGTWLCGCSTLLLWKMKPQKKNNSNAISLSTVLLSAWQQDVDGADTSAICSGAALSTRFAKPPPTSEWTHHLCVVKLFFFSCLGHDDYREIPLTTYSFHLLGLRQVCCCSETKFCPYVQTCFVVAATKVHQGAVYLKPGADKKARCRKCHCLPIQCIVIYIII